MKILVLCIGKTSSEYLQEGIRDYTSRLTKYCQFELRFIPAVKNASTLSVDELKNRESKLFLSELLVNDHVVLLDERGKAQSSREFSRSLQSYMNAGHKRVVFIVGGAFGVNEEIVQRAQNVMSLSAMTLTHDMVRLIFMEQLYRAFTILGGEKYHHD